MMTSDFEINVKLTVSIVAIEETIEMAGYGIGYWAEAAEWDSEAKEYIITFEGHPYTLRYEDIARGISEMLSDGYNSEIIRDGKIDDVEIDMPISDQIIQYTLFGELRFA